MWPFSSKEKQLEAPKLPELPESENYQKVVARITMAKVFSDHFHRSGCFIKCDGELTIYERFVTFRGTRVPLNQGEHERLYCLAYEYYKKFVRNQSEQNLKEL